MGSVSENFPDISFIEDATIDDVVSAMISDYQTKYKEITGKDVSLAQADPYRLIMYACAVQIYQGMQYADNAGKMSFLKYATGDYLDNLAALRGVERIQATAATTTIKFTVESAIASVVAIPAGTRVSNGNGVYFATDEYTEIAAGETEVSVTATCTEAGTTGNDFEAGEFTTLVNTLAYISEVTNTTKTSGGADVEDDDTLRDRIFEIPKSYSTTGSTGSYEYHAKLADSSIADVKVVSPDAGEVVVYILCDGGELPDETLLEKVEEYLDADTIRPLTDNVTVAAPDTAEYDVEFTYYIAESDKSMVTTIQSEVENAVTAYNTWQQEKIGRDINPSYLIKKLMDAGAKRVEVTSPVFTTVADNAVAQLGTATVTYGGVEDD